MYIDGISMQERSGGRGGGEKGVIYIDKYRST